MNALFKLIGVLLAALSLSGCQTNMSQAGREFDNLKQGFEKIQSEARTCSDSVNATSAAKIVTGQIIFDKPDSPDKYELLTNNSKINDLQKNALKEYLTLIPQCRGAYMQGLRSLHGGYANIAQQYYSKLDAIYVALLSGDFTIADANRAKEKAYAEDLNMRQAIHNQDRQRWQAMDAQENADRSARAAILLPMLMQQQQIQAQQQQNMYNQQMNQINNNRPVYVPPAYTPPVTTNCTTFGNQVQCTSR